MIFLWKLLGEDALWGLVVEVVTREGTEYGLEDVALRDKVESVLRQVRGGDVVVTFDEETSTASLTTTEALRGRESP